MLRLSCRTWLVFHKPCKQAPDFPKSLGLGFKGLLRDEIRNSTEVRDP